MSDVKRVSSHLARLDSSLREQRAIEEADDALFVLGGALVDRLGVIDVGEIPELDRLTCSPPVVTAYETGLLQPGTS